MKTICIKTCHHEMAKVLQLDGEPKTAHVHRIKDQMAVDLEINGALPSKL
jgi:hypothetical protein